MPPCSLVPHPPAPSMEPITPGLSDAPPPNAGPPCRPHIVCPHRLPFLLHRPHHALPVCVADLRHLNRGELSGLDRHGAIHTLLVRCSPSTCCSSSSCMLAPLLVVNFGPPPWCSVAGGSRVVSRHVDKPVLPVARCPLPCRWMYSAIGGAVAFLCATFVFPITAGHKPCILHNAALRVADSHAVPPTINNLEACTPVPALPTANRPATQVQAAWCAASWP